jgi:2'-5' RNA ligase
MTQWLGVALLPCGEQIEAAVNLQRQVGAGRLLKPVLNPIGNLPHMTIYQGPLLDSAEPEKILSLLKSEAGEEPSILASATSVFYQETGWIFLGLERTLILQRLQSKTMSLIEGCIDGSAINRDRNVSRYSDLERQNYYQYGYRYVGEAFMPHITIGRTSEELARELAFLAARSRLGEQTWTFDRLTFYEMGEDGAHASIVAEEWLGEAR